ncbi:nucleoside triphosphate pyrophosphohydrolase family protein [Desulfitobacterium hafniense]
MVEYQEYAGRTAGSHAYFENSFANFAMGLSGEAGEVTDYLKKVVFHGHELDKQKLSEELGDVLWYIAALAITAGLSLEDIAWDNVTKLKKRYPDGFDSKRSIQRPAN